MTASPEPKKPESEQDLWKETVRALGWLQIVLTDVVGLSLVGAGLGYLAERKLGWSRIVTVVLGVSGMAYGMFRVYRDFSRRAENEE